MTMKINELKTLLQNAGVVGAGGAGFPSYAKLNEAADTIILNCAECEPLLKLHRQVMEKYAFEILSALDTVCEAVGADRAIIAIKPSYKAAVESVKAQLKNFKKITIGLLPEIYPAGDEVVTIYETTGRVVGPGKLPISIGVIVYNVETMLNAYKAVTAGAGVTHKYITVTGEVKNPITLHVPIGITVGEVLKLAGGTTIKDYALISGGPMTGNIVSESDVITKTSNAILVMPPDQYIIKKRQTRQSISVKRAMSACCQCRMCTDLCPRNLLGHPIEPSKLMRSLSSGTTADTEPYLGTFFCSACGLCEMYSCFQGLAPRTLISAVKGGLRKGGIEVVSCPTCGRTRIDLISLANQVENMVADIPLDLKVAVMGCVVNGPGEAKEADIGIAGGIGEGLIIKKGEIYKKVPEDQLLSELRYELENWSK